MRPKLKVYSILIIVFALLVQQGGFNFASAVYAASAPESQSQVGTREFPATVAVVEPMQPTILKLAADSVLSVSCLPQQVGNAPQTYVQDPSLFNLNEPAGCFSLAVAAKHTVTQFLSVSSHPAGQLPRITFENYAARILPAINTALPATFPLTPVLPAVFSLAILLEFWDKRVKASTTLKTRFQRAKIFTLFELQNIRC